ncbi:sorcin-like [Varroa destructor]|uniref:EF-hand domain-containing protein n=1 Tax=Varroa destructor TaxID=109461 RepID=A0A7M7K4Y9_VARDE|nr:sorcin-like [Varroa destructor]
MSKSAATTSTSRTRVSCRGSTKPKNESDRTPCAVPPVAQLRPFNSASVRVKARSGPSIRRIDRRPLTVISSLASSLSRDSSKTLPPRTTNVRHVAIPKIVEEHFKQIDANSSGRISRSELHGAMKNITGTEFNKETIILLFGMFDTDDTGGLDLVEFNHLYDFMNEQMMTFWRLDARKQGYIIYQELMKALSMLGYRVDGHCVRVLTRKFGRTARFLELDSFIRICCLLRKLTEAFKRKDRRRKGVLTLTYYDVMHMSLSACF